MAKKSYPWVKLARQVWVNLNTSQVELDMGGSWMSRQGTLSIGNIDDAAKIRDAIKGAYRTSDWKKVSIHAENLIIRAIRAGRWHYRGL